MKQRMLIAGLSAMALAAIPVAAQFHGARSTDSVLAQAGPAQPGAPVSDQAQGVAPREGATAPPSTPGSAPSAQEFASPHQAAPGVVAPGLPPGGQSSRQIREHARAALAAIDDAQAALLAHDNDKADTHLGNAEQHLLAIYDNVPGSRLSQAIQVTERQLRRELPTSKTGKVLVDTQPLMTQLKLSQESIDQKVIAAINDGLKAQNEGHSEKFIENLDKANGLLAKDTGVWPLEDAYARVIAAREALAIDRPELASRLMVDLPDATRQVVLQAPLVPVRYQLRAAASAQAENNIVRADKLTRRATASLRDLSQGFYPTAPAIQDLANRAGQLENQLDLGKAVNPNDLRKLAEDTHRLGPPSRG